MNFIDLFILVLLAWAVFRGASRGLIMQVTTLAALILGIFAALKFSNITAGFLVEYFNVDQEYLFIISLGATFILVFFLVELVGNLLEKIVDAISLSLVNKMLGVVFSILKTVLLTGILFAYLERLDQRVPFIPENTKEKSIFFEPFSSLAKSIFPALEINKEYIEEERENIV